MRLIEIEVEMNNQLGETQKLMGSIIDKQALSMSKPPPLCRRPRCPGPPPFAETLGTTPSRWYAMRLRASPPRRGRCSVLLLPHGLVRRQCHPNVPPADTPVRRAFVEGPRRAPVACGVQPRPAGRKHLRPTMMMLHNIVECVGFSRL